MPTAVSPGPVDGGPAVSHGATAGASDPQPPRKRRGGRNLPAAIGVGVVLGAVLAAGLFIVKAAFVGIAVVAVVVGLWELTSRLKESRGLQVPLIPLSVGGAAMLIAAYTAGGVGLAVGAAFTALAVMVWRMFTAPGSPQDYLRDVSTGVFTLFYVPFLAGFVVLMLRAHDGQWRVLLFLLLTICADTGAYAVGYKFGKHKLAPAISPGKTREGLLGAVGLAMIVGAVYTQYLIDDGTWWQGLIVGFAAAVTATLGDLGESMLKRDLGIKDMGTLLPGHGGIMDRLDSLLATAPMVWLLLVVFVGS
ncbi:phosphatidate cytidylyltransferase [Mangrovactinospora gilvigrisea]|uniref:phosphatidate cytidylyltransferase n=1 Tax=Mangrovactinospora gilvigrisea TaxID=1428644 RepID=UPI001FE6BFF1|nr:phosphatidate cytidylyltransferase [Mangrovactinospora gilvigrisea]